MPPTDQFGADRIRAAREAYARQVAIAAGISTEGRIAAAFGAIARERFLGPPPWRILSGRGRMRGSTEGPADVYQDVLVSLGGEPGLNNGQPSLHALCIDALAPKTSEDVVHVGAGAGYYTAILATLVGETGRVDAYEIEPDLAERARVNLAEFNQVEVHGRSGAEGPLPECDVLYVNAAAAEPLAVWLDALKPEGRLLFPLAGRDGMGEMLLLTRQTEVEFAARFLCPVQFVPCIGAQDAEAGRALKSAFRRGQWRNVRRLVRNSQPDESCWLAGRGWWMGS
jgi:protein-L-isoaspartate(D-aspartate) O-methyltransferase